MSHPKLAIDRCISEPGGSRADLQRSRANIGCDIEMLSNNLICT